MKNVVLIFGGESAEREISIVTAMQLEEMCDRKKYNLFCVVGDENGAFYWCKNGIDSHECASGILNRKKYARVEFAFGKMWMNRNGKMKIVTDVDCAVIACHGGKGENGELVSHLNIAGIKTSVGSVQALQVAMDKVVAKHVFEGVEIPVVCGVDFLKSEWTACADKIVEKVEKVIGYPAIVKPARQGSSVGIGFVKNKKELLDSVDLALEFDNKILIEKAVKDFREFNVSVICDGDIAYASDVEEVKKSGDILSFSDKYFEGGKNGKFQKCEHKTGKNTRNATIFGRKGCKVGKSLILRNDEKFGIDIDSRVARLIKNYALAAVKAIEFYGVCRIDFLVDDSNNVFLNEVNSVPGSLAFYFWKDLNIFDKLVEIAEKSLTVPKRTAIAKFL